ncbi:MAG: DNA-directed RNA polymerase subunit beta' [Candidatus Portnoybacteria bacterium CG10_big_fil_rev_8_21_14_0_10_44_7]|uniref:DNA-directed RNA polymerase subunit beta' n=1 Tax=Candidatus Portnoybacteria bacterium CG10_big_fil_rev_8_21_14_0_10_44_7 TaxID=1974816 RepID=A0A2M8KIX5_9BACT|nr:MAG: DNA-directed RNA polymerase subunit beta' [Candidatus Portnoybacteria bacterium CG10_big_fil_rev_8_21_14_0_10_44_7]
MSVKVSDFQSIKLKLASPEEILGWSHGEILKPETINYRTQKPEKDGLFCERIFGPEKDFECYCGKYKRIRYKGIICDKCGVEVTRSIVRRERMGHIKLATPVSHIWFLRGVPSRMGLILDMSQQELEKVIYFTAYLVVGVDEPARQAAMAEVEKEFKSKKKEAKRGELKVLKEGRDKTIAQLKALQPLLVLSENEYFDLSLRFGHVFEAAIGAEAIKTMMAKVDLGVLVAEIKNNLKKASVLAKKRLHKRLRLAEGMRRAGIRPEWMVFDILPVLPPDLRPMVALDGGRYATSDLNDLYRRVINRNNRLKKLIELKAPEVIARNEKRMLQEAVDALIDNSARRGQGPVMAATGQKRQLKSLADMLKGKQGRFRQNLLGKRVDYSGRSVIVVGPELKLFECGLPKKMALELFKPFVIQKLVERELAHNIRGAGRLIEQETDEVWAILEEIIIDRRVLLNRAPTLHRLGIQAFQPVLIEGSAIQLHPLVCSAFNADFDGDQMAVHVPLTEEAQTEAKNIMLSAKNLLKPATGQPIATPTQDIILGCFWITKIIPGARGEKKVFASPQEVVLAYQFREVDPQAEIYLPETSLSPKKLKDEERGQAPSPKLIQTCAGRIIFNNILPLDYEFVNRELAKKTLLALVADLIEKYGSDKAQATLDEIKRLGYEYATRSGISWGMDDLVISAEKEKIMQQADKEVEEVHKQYLAGLLAKEERRARIIEIWGRTKDEIAKAAVAALDPSGSVYTIISSGARGSWGQTAQMVGMKGLVVNPAGEIIELPVKSSFKEGFNVLEYFISTHGARKGTSDTALRTSTAGYLTRRLVDVAQDVVVRQENCGTKDGIYVYRQDGVETNRSLASRIVGRVAAETIAGIVKTGELIDKEKALAIDQTGAEKVLVRSVITCKTKYGVCQRCYGWDLGNNQLVQMGAAVGIVTAQAIGEPGTQLTMRTFHTGGVAGGGDITQGLPRVEEIFEARTPRGQALLSEVDGKVAEIEKQENGMLIKITPNPEFLQQKTAKVAKKKSTRGRKPKTKDFEYLVPSRSAVWVEKGDLVTSGQQLSEGHLDLKTLYKAADREAVQRYVLREVQQIYASQGEGLSDKHIEIIIRQMFSRVRVKDAGDTNLLVGSVVEKSTFDLENQKAKKAGKKTAKGGQLLYGISRVSLSTDSWLSAASFQETTKVLIDASVQGKEDRLSGLKENVIIGKLIPAGTGFRRRAS